ncbi:COG4315 family predicted lipoprotein [Microbacterium sp. RD1]|uniref:COG4315 family predicted lipoprotein n=1 Tax=Microbacterium sp. RD1 TaxID=3457313 RepID=UPI003FA5AD9D
MALRRRLAAALLAGALVLAVSACAAPDVEGDAARAAQLSLLDAGELGEVLVDGEGNVLYVFLPDAQEAVSCTFTCATNWPPLAAKEDALPDAGEGVRTELIGTLPNPAGGEVVTYGGWPLYRYAADRTPGEHRGQDTYLNGGVWLVIGPDGEPVDPAK